MLMSLRPIEVITKLLGVMDDYYLFTFFVEGKIHLGFHLVEARSQIPAFIYYKKGETRHELVTNVMRYWIENRAPSQPIITIEHYETV